ncbi:DUF4105 domain-containing protein [Desulfuromonas acetexigens]|uniref:DUF4105 domain-containing protein n=1 Tax=Trichloromonas acetexigens TaxID=38815 RepID=A0A550JFF8_9BACT|nr:DUF4105 domain-containing protein [Desulfuromonas acetexigens]
MLFGGKQQHTRHKAPWWALCLVFCLLVSGGEVWAEVSDFSRLLRQAQDRQLHEQRYWQVLLHYQQGSRGLVSPVDDPDFFLASDGKTDPAAELEATIQALFGKDEERRNITRCRFPARYEWLAQELGVTADLSFADCSDLGPALERIAPRRATLVFPGSYPNSPASMFGHTLLNFSGPHESKLLAHAANYSAFTDESNGFTYAVKGLTGLYRGYFSLLPYYEKLKEYSGLERRDIWEYPLNLTPEETRRMFLHLWELRDIYSDYFFFDENCSYNLLFLLEAARPSLRLTDTKPLWVLPVDTIRWLDREGLLDEAWFRPSLATLLQQEMASLSTEDLLVARSLATGALPTDELDQSVPDTNAHRRILQVAARAVEQDFLSQRIDLPTYRTRVLQLLTARSRLGRSEDTEEESKHPVRPDHGHGPSRLSLGVGYAAGEWVQEIRYRPVYHDLLDDEAGYLSGAQIVLGQVAVRYLHENERLRLERLDLVDLRSLTPVTPWHKPISWQVRVGAQQVWSDEGEDRLAFHFNPGAGYAARFSSFTGYVLMESELRVGRGLEEGYGMGVGGSAGLLMRWGAWRGHGRIRFLDYPLGDRHESTLVAFDQNYRLDRDHSLRLEFSRRLDLGHWESAALLFWNHYW